MRDVDEISSIFESAVEKKLAALNANRSDPYVEGVAAALGWALEEYDEVPVDKD